LEESGEPHQPTEQLPRLLRDKRMTGDGEGDRKNNRRVVKMAATWCRQTPKRPKGKREDRGDWGNRGLNLTCQLKSAEGQEGGDRTSPPVRTGKGGKEQKNSLFVLLGGNEQLK